MAEVIHVPPRLTAEPGTDRILPSGDEAGTAPGDRPFRPDVEGLRAVAVLLVVLFHSGVSLVSGGYVGVDVFFVISGFVITGVLLRERSSTGGTSILAFYGRRCRRIIPAATLVIIATVIMAYWFLGVAGGIPTATDGRWAAVFLANFHFIATGTNYLSAQQPPSPLQNFWSLAVEEQFYVVYPTLFLLVAGVRMFSLRMRLALCLIVVVGVSFSYSVIDTSNNPVDAYFSPFTRAWELALGALVAVATPWLLKVPARLAASATWLGLGAILIAACSFGSQTPYPGSLVAIPVVGAALLIAGGMNAHAAGSEVLLRLSPFRWLGRHSYSLYLWHWPILIIAAEYAGETSLPVRDNLGWDIVALIASVVTYRLIENPIRHAVSLRRIRWASIGLGVGLVAATLGILAIQPGLSGAGAEQGTSIQNSSRNWSPFKPTGAPIVGLHSVLGMVKSSTDIRVSPENLTPSVASALTNPDANIGFPPVSTGCLAGRSNSRVPACMFGDPRGSRTIVLYGDSHAGMWFRALDDIAIRTHWRLVPLFKPGCPASLVEVGPGSLHPVGSQVVEACNKWHQFAIRRIKSLDPNMVIVSETYPYPKPDGALYSDEQWQLSIENLFRTIATPHTANVFIGNPPAPPLTQNECLARNLSNVQECSQPIGMPYRAANAAEARAAREVGAAFIDVVPWFCARTCTAIAGSYKLYVAGGHVTLAYSLFLEGVLQSALHLQT